MKAGPISAVLLSAVLCVTPGLTPARADFADGARAYDGGNYGLAFREWMALAMAGNPMAQTAIAGMFRFGEGRDPDPSMAASWYRRAALLGEPVAQMNLGEMYLWGVGVQRDLVEAFVWLSLAAEQGKRWAADQKDKFLSSMPDAQKESARALLNSRRRQIRVNTMVRKPN